MMSSASLPAERLADVVRKRLQDARHRLSAYWYAITGDRDDYATQLRASLSNDPVAVLVVRSTGFDNPNAVLNDLVELVELNRTLCEDAILPNVAADGTCGVVLLARTELCVAQASSPVVLPEWFPMGGGATIACAIEDLTWTAETPLSAPEARVGEVCELLFRLEGALLHRLERVHGRNHGACNQLLELLRNEDGESFSEIMRAASDYRDTITTPTAFRPSVREAQSLVARLWGLLQKQTDDSLAAPAKALAAALEIPESDLTSYESLTAVLRRPSNRDPSRPRRLARNLLVTLSASCQFITAAAHSDDYQAYPVALVRSISLDLRRSLSDAEAYLLAL